MIKEAAAILPTHRPSRNHKKWYKDSTLSRLSKNKKEAWDTWKREGRPTSGPVYEQKIKTREEVRKRMRVCEANDQRRKIQQIDKKFKAGCKTKFQRTSARRTGSKIRVNGELITDHTAVLCAWKDHFETLGQSRNNVDEVIQMADARVQELLSESHHNREDILDTAFQLEEIEML